MKFIKWLVCSVLFSSLWMTTTFSAQAAADSSIQNESIYDLYVDRYFNSTVANDFNVNIKDHLAFAGGDFKGIMDKMDHIRDLGFTILSIGPVFSTESYDGKAILDFNEIEKHFGTAEEFEALIEKTHNQKMKLMIEFPLNNYSAQHTWANDEDKQDWILSKDGALQLDLKNPEVQTELLDTIVAFANEYEIDAVKISEIEGAPTEFINQMITALKEVRNPMYVIALEESDANFDVNYSEQRMIDFRDAFKNTDYPSDVINTVKSNDLLLIDNLESERFTYHSALENMFPPTRIRSAMGTLLTLPGVPYMTYGTEIAMNGQVPEESHQIMNFRVDEELIEYIQDVNSIRNKSAALRSSDIEVLKNENGYAVYKREAGEETFLIVVNNTSATQRIDLSSEIIGEDKEVRGIFESDLIRTTDDGSYRIVIDREIVEVFQVTDRKGLNTAYIIAMAISYLLFILFLVIVWKKGKQRRRDDENKAK